MHLSPELCRMFLQGEIAGKAFASAALSHLLDGCDDCRQVWEQIESMKDGPQVSAQTHFGTRQQDRSGPHGHEEITKHEARLTELRKERRRARRDLKILLQLAPEVRAKRIENARTRFRSSLFVELLLEEARNQVRQNAKASADLAALVPVAIHWMAGKVDNDWAFQVTCMASAVEANALRISGEFAAADQLFRDLKKRTRQHPTLRSAELAEITTFEAALRCEQRNYEDAERLLDLAILHHRLAGKARGLAQSLILQGQVHSAKRAFDQAHSCYAKVIATLDPEKEPFLVQCAVTGQVNCLVALESFDRAQDLLSAHRHLYEGQDTYAAAVLRGLEGEIAIGRGLWSTAEAAYSECRDGCLEIGRDHDATIACLQIARAMLEQGELSQVVEMASDVLEIFRARGADQEALSALILIQEAAASRTLTTAILSKVRRRLESHSG